MSMDTCKCCGRFVDTDEEPEAYILAKESIGQPSHKQDHVCICENCREEIPEDELEARSA